MGQYSIKELESLSGIKAHTIRIWEQRYSLISPERTNSGVRYYSDEQLKKLLNIALLNRKGYKISQIASLTDSDIIAKINDVSMHSNHDMGVYIDMLVTSMISLDQSDFEKQFADIVLKYGFEDAILNVIYPFLEKIGLLWQTGVITPAQEHFVSNILRRKLYVAIDNCKVEESKIVGKAILLLPEHELHEIGLLFVHYILKKNNYKVYYLGQAVPYVDFLQIQTLYQAELIVLSLTSPFEKDGELEEYLKNVADDCSNSRIFVTGYQAKVADLKLPENVIRFNTIVELKNLLTK